MIANDTNIYGVQVINPACLHGTLTLNGNGTFSYAPNASWAKRNPTDSFNYCGNGATSGPACATVTLNVSTIADADAITRVPSAPRHLHLPIERGHGSDGESPRPPGRRHEGASLPDLRLVTAIDQ